MRLSVTLLLALSLSTASAQPQCALRQVSFHDGSNKELYRSNTDNLAVILVDAFLAGKLVAYKVAPLDSTIRHADLQPLSARDLVMMDGVSVNPETAERPQAKKQKITMADLKPLSKGEFLHQMTIDDYEPTKWDKATLYEAEGGAVYHNGRGYSAIKESTGIPPPNKVYWELVSNGHLPFYSRVPDLAAFSIFGQYESPKSKNSWRPLLIRVTRTAEVPTYLVDMTVSFKYADVLNYLRTINQPLLYHSAAGYIGGGTFVLEDNPMTPRTDGRATLDGMVRKQINDSEPFKSSFVIKDETLFDAYVLGTFSYPPSALYQDPSGKEFRIYKGEAFVASIPTSAVEQAFSFVKPELRTWSQALERNSFKKFEVKVEGIVADLPSAAPATLSSPEPRPGYFLEQYTINTIGMTHVNHVYKIMAQLSKMVAAQFTAGTLPLAEKRDTFFPAKFDWSTVPEVKARASGVKPAYMTNILHHLYVTEPEYPYYWDHSENVTYLHKKLSRLQTDSLEFGVTYKRALTEKGTTFQPFQISIIPEQQSAYIKGNLPCYTFNWADFRRVALAGTDPLLKELIAGIEKGTLPFGAANVVYGLIEEGK